jgi:D-lactate dehydrogenase
MDQRKVGIVGTGRIGESAAKILLGFGCQVLAYDVQESENLKKAGVRYVDLDELLAESEIISLHVPLLPQTRRIINAAAIDKMKDGVMLINTSRGELVETDAVIEGIKSGKIGALGVDVYEEEEGIFFEDLSNAIVADDKLMRLVTFPNVILTSHQAFFTREAMENIARNTVQNISDIEEKDACDNALA